MFQVRPARRPLVVVVCLLTLTLPLFAESLYEKKEHATIHIRLVAREAPAAATAFGNNVDEYLVEVTRKSGDSELARLSFRSLSYEATLPATFRDYSVVHTFRALRAHDCDASVAQLYAHQLQYTAGAPTIRALADSVLPCYVVTPGDYKGSKRDRNIKVAADSNGPGAASAALHTKAGKKSVD